MSNHRPSAADRLLTHELERQADRDSARDDCSLHAMATALRTDALELLETATQHGVESPELVGRMQAVANELGALERLLEPAAYRHMPVAV